jgi:hypothetical protein
MVTQVLLIKCYQKPVDAIRIGRFNMNTPGSLWREDFLRDILARMLRCQSSAGGADRTAPEGGEEA